MNMMKTDTAVWFPAEGPDGAEKNPALAKLMAAWEGKLARKSAKIGGFGLMAVSLAACGSSSSDDDDTTSPPPPPPPPPPPTEDTVGSGDDGQDDSDGAATVVVTGADGDTVSMTDVINAGLVLLEEFDGDITLDDLQAATNASGKGAAGTTYKLSDINQNDDEGVVTLTVDRQASNGDDTTIDIEFNEVEGTVAILGEDGEAIEIVNIDLGDLDPAEASALFDLIIAGVETLSVSGGSDGSTFTVENPLDGTIELFDGTGSGAALVLDFSEALGSTYLGSPQNDVFLFGDTLTTGDVVDMGDGTDAFSVVMTTNGPDRAPTIDNAEIMHFANTVTEGMDFDNVNGLNTIKLGLTGIADVTGNAGNVDFDNVKAETNLVEVYGNQQHLEMDYVSGADTDLVINAMTDTGAVNWMAGGADDVIELRDVGTLEINNTGADDLIFGSGEDDGVP